MLVDAAVVSSSCGVRLANKDDDDDIPDDDELTEESYRTTIDENPEDLDITVDDLDDDEY